VVGDCRTVLAELPSDHYRCCVTSPPYWGLREYGHEDQIGLEETVGEYVEQLVRVFRGVRRVLTGDGTLWLNLGDTYASGNRTWRAADKKNPARAMPHRSPTPVGMKGKDLVGVPWAVAFALRADGWYLRADVIWKKPNCLPESVQDRPTLDYEHVFLFSKRETYFYDADALREPAVWGNHFRNVTDPIASKAPGRSPHNGLMKTGGVEAGRNARSVWEIQCNKSPAGTRVPAFPIELPRRCILAGSQRGDRVLDPFGGSGTTGRAAVSLGRCATMIELNPEEGKKAMDRTAQYGLL
jgi:site-specific DNA-methyltransferase (cytosine-N4-specific)